MIALKHKNKSSRFDETNSSLWPIFDWAEQLTLARAVVWHQCTAGHSADWCCSCQHRLWWAARAVGEYHQLQRTETVCRSKCEVSAQRCTNGHLRYVRRYPCLDSPSLRGPKCASHQLRQWHPPVTCVVSNAQVTRVKRWCTRTYLFAGPVIDHCSHLSAILHWKVHTASTAEQRTELDARSTDCGRVHDGC